MAEAVGWGYATPGAAAPEAATGGSRTTNYETTLVVENMICGACIRKIEDALLAVPGVTAARANLSARRVRFTTVEEPTSHETFVRALEGAGYKAAAASQQGTAAEEDRDRDYLRRVGVAGFAAANIMLMSVSVWAGHGNDMPQSLKTLFHWLSAIVALPAVAYAGKPFFTSALAALEVRRLNMDVPISLGVSLATLMSLYQTIRGSEQVYFDAAISLLFFLLIGRYLDLMMRTRANGAALNLLSLQSSEATVIAADGRAERILAARIEPGMRILVAAGERLAVDGRLESPAASIDDSLITGESLPRHLAAGDPVYAGTINLGAPVAVEATGAADNTLIADLARLMEAAQQSRSAYVRLADRAAHFYAPAVHILGAATFVGWLALGHGWEAALTAAVAVLIITCPCALALAVPVVQVVAVGRLLRGGIVLKAADGLERLAEVDYVVLDKTGTLTLPELRLAAHDPVSDADLAAAARLAQASRHPYSRAVVSAAKARGLDVEPAAGVREMEGAGLEWDGPAGVVRLGSARFCGASDDQGFQPTLLLSRPDAPTVVFRFEETLRPDARATVSRLGAMGLGVEVLSGDRPEPVATAAAAAGIREYRARQTPDAKLARLEELRRAGRKVLMVGDGLNDAPALAAGHASLSPSTAADISQTVADAMMQGERLGAVADAVDLARSTRRRALENFGIAIAYNFIFVPLAVVGLVTPLIAAIAMSASSIAVTANAMRLGLVSKPHANMPESKP